MKEYLITKTYNKTNKFNWIKKICIFMKPLKRTETMKEYEIINS